VSRARARQKPHFEKEQECIRQRRSGRDERPSRARPREREGRLSRRNRLGCLSLGCPAELQVERARIDERAPEDLLAFGDVRPDDFELVLAFGLAKGAEKNTAGLFGDRGSSPRGLGIR
jgi:hypothetical protein